MPVRTKHLGLDWPRLLMEPMAAVLRRLQYKTSCQDSIKEHGPMCRPRTPKFLVAVQVQSAQMAQIAFGSFSPNSPPLIAAPRSSQPFAVAGLRRQSSEPSMHAIHSMHSVQGLTSPHPGSMRNGLPTYHQPLPGDAAPCSMHMHAEYHQWSPFVGHMPMTPGTFNAIQRGEFCGPGWSQNGSPSGSGYAVPATPPTTPSTPASGSHGWRGLRPGLNVQVPPAGTAWQEHGTQVKLLPQETN